MGSLIPEPRKSAIRPQRFARLSYQHSAKDAVRGEVQPIKGLISYQVFCEAQQRRDPKGIGGRLVARMARRGLGEGARTARLSGRCEGALTEMCLPNNFRTLVHKSVAGSESPPRSKKLSLRLIGRFLSSPSQILATFFCSIFIRLPGGRAFGMVQRLKLPRAIGEQAPPVSVPLRKMALHPRKRKRKESICGGRCSWRKPHNWSCVTLPRLH